MNMNHGGSTELVKTILSFLPGVDCCGLGGCGKETCQACAQAIAESANPAMCPACNQEKIDAIAELLGVPSIAAKNEIAFVSCSGSAAGKRRFADCKTCKEAVKSGFQRGECKDGCVGAVSYTHLKEGDSARIYFTD